MVVAGDQVLNVALIIILGVAAAGDVAIVNSDMAAEQGGLGVATDGWGASWGVVDSSTGTIGHTRFAFCCSDSGGTEGTGIIKCDMAVGQQGSECKRRGWGLCCGAVGWAGSECYHF